MIMRCEKRGVRAIMPLVKKMAVFAALLWLLPFSSLATATESGLTTTATAAQQSTTPTEEITTATTSATKKPTRTVTWTFGTRRTTTTTATTTTASTTTTATQTTTTTAVQTTRVTTTRKTTTKATTTFPTFEELPAISDTRPYGDNAFWVLVIPVAAVLLIGGTVTVLILVHKPTK